MAIKEGDFIRLSYNGTVNGSVFDTTHEDEAKKAGIHSKNAIYGPVTICVGQKHVILGLDEELVGKKAGAEGTVTVEPAKAFGERDPKKLQSFPKNKFSEKPVRGMPVKMEELGEGTFLIARAHERYRGPKHIPGFRGQQGEVQIRRLENRILAKLVFINTFNGLAIGLTGPLISYWFALRFQVGPLAIAPIMAATFVITGAASLLTGWLTGRIGIVPSVVWERLIGIGLMVLLPIMPTFWLASLVFLLRSVFSRGSAGAQQALTVGLVREQRRGLAASLNAVSFQLPRSVGPGIAGYLLQTGQFSLPFYAGAVLQAIYLVWYRRTFRFYEPPRRGPGGPADTLSPPVSAEEIG